MMKEIRWLAWNVPIIRGMAGLLSRLTFRGSQDYWETRYAMGKTSGFGSYGVLAEFKAEILNSFVENKDVKTVIEFGCGDGNQLILAKYPSYIGLDVSRTAIRLCRQRFEGDNTKRFFLYHPESFVDRRRIFTAELALSLDVIYHLVEDHLFELYMSHLFSAATRFVIIYSSDSNNNSSSRLPYLKHRKFSEWVTLHVPDWRFCEKIPNKYPFKGNYRTGSFADFFIYEKR